MKRISFDCSDGVPCVELVFRCRKTRSTGNIDTKYILKEIMIGEHNDQSKMT